MISRRSVYLLSTPISEKAVYEARLGSATAAKENADLQLSYTKVAAPAAGIVSRKQVEVGQLVQPGQPLMTIVADTGVFVTANFKETQLATLKVGQPVDLEIDAYPGCEAKGKVASLSAATGAKFARDFVADASKRLQRRSKL